MASLPCHPEWTVADLGTRPRCPAMDAGNGLFGHDLCKEGLIGAQRAPTRYSKLQQYIASGGGKISLENKSGAFFAHSGRAISAHLEGADGMTPTGRRRNEFKPKDPAAC